MNSYRPPIAKRHREGESNHRKFFRSLFENLNLIQRDPPYGSAWDSSVMAAYEEWGDTRSYTYVPHIKEGCTLEFFVSTILGLAKAEPKQDEFIKLVSRNFEISEEDAMSSIDRALGGVVRAASLNPRACPDRSSDPVASIAFEQAFNDHSIIDAIYPMWRSWKPGVHSDIRDNPPR